MKYSNARRRLLLFCGLIGVAGCGWRLTFEDASSQDKYKDLVGANYRVIGPLHAYGVRDHSKAPVIHVALMPPPGIGGSEIAFRELIVEGSEIKIHRVLLSNRVFDSRLTFEVKLSPSIEQSGVPIYIDFMRGNESSDGFTLNPAVYKKIGI